ncbi:MAG: FAD:protein FMN transferase [Gammaproteobacteria bacterium]|nr:FAD:protein FMN transferase [Gammaproteobacteria bacterium]MBU1448012.1 FAD:protein FMN transferase [Gammaproteobacteria bacterium]MDD5471155.1 FAD:protein FMN transferase [Sideroxydans sp.]
MKTVWALLVAFLALTGCSKQPFHQEQAYVFGTIVEVSIYGEDEDKAHRATAAVLAEFQRLHDMLHAWQPSELSSLNTAIAQGKTFKASPELAMMLRDAARVSAQSGGTFNPAIGALVQIWGFQADDFKPVLPDMGKVATLLKAHPQMSDLVFKGDRISSRNRAVKLDLGGYAKGYALDRAATILHTADIRHALINIGGNVLALGAHGDRPWRVGIQHPRKPGAIATLELRSGEAIGTSGDYQRYFELDGKRYCHLLDPRNGQPVQGVQAVTILTHGEHAGLRSDSASKPLFIAGVAGWPAAASAMDLNDALLIDAAGKIHLTASMQKRLEFTDKQTVLSVEP